MKLQVTQENLARALNAVARIANTKSTLPILSNVLVKTIGTRLLIAATNLEIAISYYVGSKVAEEGTITVPARLMQDFINTLPNGVISLETDDQKLTIKTNGYNSVINGVSADEFPVMPTITKGKKWFVAASQLKTALNQVVLAASSDEMRPTLTAVYLYNKGAYLVAVATDSYRLAEKQIAKTSEEIKLMVPAAAMQDLLKLIGDYDGDIEVNHDGQQVLFKVGDVELVARLIEGEYPDYVKLIPAKFETSATLAREDLVKITKVSSLFARENAGSVTIQTDQKAGKITIRSVASQVGENDSSAKAKVTNSSEITLNSKYLLDALQVIDTKEVVLGFNGKLEPCVVAGSGEKDYRHIIMPLKS